MRHGQSKANVPGIIVSRIETDRRGDWGLSELGREQVLEAAARACGLPGGTVDLLIGLRPRAADRGDRARAARRARRCSSRRRCASGASVTWKGQRRTTTRGSGPPTRRAPGPAGTSRDAGDGVEAGGGRARPGDGTGHGPGAAVRGPRHPAGVARGHAADPAGGLPADRRGRATGALPHLGTAEIRALRLGASSNAADQLRIGTGSSPSNSGPGAKKAAQVRPVRPGRPSSLPFPSSSACRRDQAQARTKRPPAIRTPPPHGRRMLLDPLARAGSRRSR